MTVTPLNSLDYETFIERLLENNTVVKSFIIQESLLARLEDFKVKHHKISESQIIQEALVGYFERRTKKTKSETLVVINDMKLEVEFFESYGDLIRRRANCLLSEATIAKAKLVLESTRGY